MTDTITVVQTAIKIVEVITEGPLPSDANVKTAYENNANTNAFTDAEQTKLTGIETAATADQTDAEIKTAYEANVNTNVFTDVQKGLVDGQQAALDLKASIVFVDNSIAAIVDSSPAALDTLNELAAALGDDANFATTVNTSISNKVAKAGDTMTGPLLAANGLVSAPSYSFSGDTDTGMFLGGAGNLNFAAGGGNRLVLTAAQTQVLNDLRIGADTANSVVLVEDAQHTLALRNGTNAQDFRLYGTFTDASNYERLSIKHQFGLITFASQAAGTGSVRDFAFTDGQVLLEDGSAASPSIAFNNDTDTGIFSSGVGSINLVVAGITQAKAISSEFQIINQLRIGALSGTSVFLTDDAANTLAQRNGTNAQAFNLYNTFTDVSNYERLSIKHASNVITFASEAAGTGTVRDFNFSGGNVGIGTATPTVKLHIESVGDEILRLARDTSTGSPFLSFYQAGARRSFIQHLDAEDNLRVVSEVGIITFLAGGGERLRVAANGKVGIGTTTPQDTLHIKGTDGVRFIIEGANTALGEQGIQFQHTTTSSAGYIGSITKSGGGVGTLIFSVTSSTTGEAMRIDVDGKVGIGETTPTGKLTVKNTDTAVAVLINQDGNGDSLQIDPESTTAHVIQVLGAKQTTGDVLRLRDADALTTGHILNVHSNSINTSTRKLVEIVNDNTLATGTTALSIQQDAAQRALFIDQNGNGNAIEIDSEATTSDVIDIFSPATTTGNVLDIVNVNALTTGRLARFSSNSADTSARTLVFIHNDNALATGATPLSIQQDAANQAMIIDQNAASSFIDYQGTAAANATDPISTLTTSGATTNHIQIEINGVKAWIAVSTTDPTA